MDVLVEECQGLLATGVRSVILFGIPARKDAQGSEAYAEDGIIQQAVRAVRAAVPTLLVCTDVCLCEYTDHGHCGLVDNGDVSNDATLELLARMALSHARAGAQMVAPSDMMDGRVGALRTAPMRTPTGTVIMAYSPRPAFYGSSAKPRIAAAVRRPPRYQMDIRNAREVISKSPRPG